jgi:23S rRNA (uridine2552-2'-O)-methyltransferase
MSFKVKDYYYKKAKKEKFVARSIYKLEEIDKKFKILKPNQMILDLGYFPGSWIQYASKKVGHSGKVYGVDIQGPPEDTVKALKNVKVYKDDVFQIDDMGYFELNECFDVILSDMAPSTTGIKSVDQIKSLELVEKVFQLHEKLLKKGGNMVIKIFESHEAQLFLKSNKKKFNNFDFFKPQSTRSISKEYFVVGRGFKDI